MILQLLRLHAIMIKYLRDQMPQTLLSFNQMIQRHKLAWLAKCFRAKQIQVYDVEICFQIALIYVGSQPISREGFKLNADLKLLIKRWFRNLLNSYQIEDQLIYSPSSQSCGTSRMYQILQFRNGSLIFCRDFRQSHTGLGLIVLMVENSAGIEIGTLV
ncbi:hypothetical protein FGO68_gene10489 [Halteria grandinella]|uniref:Uncharacterized protein n=1 Tax=Halteria grandinella TaxID=5974 RepID=A0A8J8NY60_HALGN|nr:hypothetical protein FGO68_gene10489 [Halteria grandinella]